jgi:hypothetical protein
MKAAGGQSRESRDDIGIGSVRRPGERGQRQSPRLLLLLLSVTTDQ